MVQSGPNGGYSLPVAAGDVLFITKPAGYTLPLYEDNLPRFHYVHDPDGTPAEFGLRFQGIAPTGPLPGSIDFPLKKSPEPDDFKVIWFADTQAQTPAELDYLRNDVVAELIGTDAAFGVTAGDVICRRIRLMGCSESVTRNSSQTQQIRSSKRQRTTP